MSKNRKGRDQAPAAKTPAPPATPASAPAPAQPSAPSSLTHQPLTLQASSLTPVGFDYRKLALASPQAEFETYARSKVKTAERLGQKDEVELLLAAFEMGKVLLARKPEGQS